MVTEPTVTAIHFTHKSGKKGRSDPPQFTKTLPYEQLTEN